MTMIKASDIKPGDKFNIMGMELFASCIRYTGGSITIDFENERTIGNPFVTSIIISCTFNTDTWVTKV